jgi:hypothetical protein
MTVIAFPRQPVRPATDDTLRSDCERLMRRLVRDRCASEHELRALAEFLDHIITRAEDK